jgi:hypothetical protein
MTEALTALMSLALPIVALVLIGRRRQQPAWITGGTIAGFLTLAVGIVWAANIGADALWAAMGCRVRRRPLGSIRVAVVAPRRAVSGP